MGSKETNFFYTILIAGSVFLLVFLAFMVTIFKYRKKGFTSYLKKVATDFTMLELEKKRIATDVHDGIGSNLSAVRLLVDELLASERTDVVLRSKLTTTLQQMSVSVREVSNHMIPYALQREGLVTAITELTGRLFHNPAIKITTRLLLHNDQVTEETALQIYRIVQELLNNIIKHARASSVHISLEEYKETIVLTIRDNGVGFDKQKVQKASKGIGLLSVSSRVISLHGNMYLTTSAGKGTEYVIELPLADDMLGRRI